MRWICGTEFRPPPLEFCNKLHLNPSRLKLLLEWMDNQVVEIHIKKVRKRTAGSYRPPNGERTHHIITINEGLREDFCFFVLTHEVAHLRVFLTYGKAVRPHGKEWKMTFAKLLEESISLYSEDFQQHIKQFLNKTNGSIGVTSPFLKEMYPKDKAFTLLGSIPPEVEFRLGKRWFKKIEKRKTRYLCKEIYTGKMYLISSKAPVEELKVPNE